MIHQTFLLYFFAGKTPSHHSDKCKEKREGTLKQQKEGNHENRGKTSALSYIHHYIYYMILPSMMIFLHH